MFGITDFIIIGFIFLLSFSFWKLGRKVFFDSSFPKNEVSSYLKTQGGIIKSFRKISSNEIPEYVFFQKQNLLYYNIFLFKIVYFEVTVDYQKPNNDNQLYVKFYKPGMGLFLKDKIYLNKN